MRFGHTPGAERRRGAHAEVELSEEVSIRSQETFRHQVGKGKVET